MAKSSVPSDTSRSVREQWLAQIAHDDECSAAFKIAWALAGFMNSKTRQCWPGAMTLGAMTNLSRKSISKHLATLTDRGHLHIQRQQRDVAIFTMLLGLSEVAFGRRQATGENWQVCDDGAIKIVVEEPVEVPF